MMSRCGSVLILKMIKILTYMNMEKQTKNQKKYIVPYIMLAVGLVIGWAISTSSNQHINRSASSAHQHISTLN